MEFISSLQFAKKMDRADPLRRFRSQFLLPKTGTKSAIYLTGNSLGLQPKATEHYVAQELQDWAKLGVGGHEHASNPWLYYHKFTKKALARIVGARTDEVVAMNQLTVNLHLMLVSFYRPTKQRYKIIIEAGAFSSDQYAFESHLRYHGLNPDQALIEIHPRPGEYTLRTADIVATIEAHASELAVVFLAGVQYYTGQFFNIPEITRAGHAAGAYVGFDLAHAVGNVPLSLHKHNVDFAVWCSYKYLNSGPGGMAGIYVHHSHGRNFMLPRFAGWWGHSEKERFKMRKGFIPTEGVDGWQLSNVPVLQGAAHRAALSLFEQTSMVALRKKSLLLTGYLEFLLGNLDPESQFFRCITPGAVRERGCQLSLLVLRDGKRIFKELTRAGVVADWRDPDVIRVAPAPFYNTFEDVYRFVSLLRKQLLKK
jgi:kynureninase